ncbi:GNAT family N-acetyltransferase [Sphingomonas koreensis]|uniref:GNAT family N-acetyltransferase n=1 Tax=Sphingomonas koreensis TaxID=93064 RepID=UPI0008372B38|nr:GNAT family N-acetyltransferase [Sphingomonas koreensis]PJI88625.1 ribosomal-protein-alanine N-acetyltransferase [Sphingomonas koreensis]RSU58799.1 GNAT family N-acetyltransferase [Sphingomonas koreensis]RSU67164.1 GNAT family N-acetyltransferase [Sphingomonas koreensis]
MSTAPQIVEIVHGTPADIAMLNAIMADAFDPRFGEAWTPSQCLGMIALPGVWFSIAWSGNRPAGFALARAVADEAELLLLAIRPAFRRSGIGTALLRSIVADAHERGAEMLHLEVRANNEAIRLYRNEGFEKIGERHDYYRGNDGKLFDAHTFSKHIR